MPHRYFILPEEREELQRKTIKRVISSIKGTVGFCENRLGQETQIIFTNDAIKARTTFCKLALENPTLRDQFKRDNEAKISTCKEPEISLCWLGVHNIICPVTDDYGRSVTLLGGEFLVRERRAEAEQQFEMILSQYSIGQQTELREAWAKVPEVSEKEAFGHILQALDLAGRAYLYDLKQRNDFHNSADLATHDVVIALQALISEIEVLKIDLKKAFGIGSKWEERFENLITLCEQHNRHLEKNLLNSDKFKFAPESISKLIYESVDFYRSKAKTRGIEFRIELEQIVDEEGNHRVLLVRMDRNALRQAMRNVIDNAVKYSFTGTADKPRWIDIIGQPKTAQQVSGYSIIIRNLGIGIEHDELELVFEPGYQGKRRLNESRPGHGIGLAFVKDCIEEHGGIVAIDSQLQQRTGWLTTLHIWLPLYVSS